MKILTIYGPASQQKRDILADVIAFFEDYDDVKVVERKAKIMPAKTVSDFNVLILNREPSLNNGFTSAYNAAAYPRVSEIAGKIIIDFVGILTGKKK
ncbi:MAG: hypothetical protein V4478_01230 [Patescibacteria group bacterium]